MTVVVKKVGQRSQFCPGNDTSREPLKTQWQPPAQNFWGCWLSSSSLKKKRCQFWFLCFRIPLQYIYLCRSHPYFRANCQMLFNQYLGSHHENKNWVFKSYCHKIIILWHFLKVVKFAFWLVENGPKNFLFPCFPNFFDST